jgi:glutathione synthase/RimK-type ligase-like ATP-grasp enzyme
MILVWGDTADSPVARVLDALQARGADTVLIDAAALERLRYDIRLQGLRLDGWIETAGRRLPVADITGLYLRPGEPASPAARTAAMALTTLASGLPGQVVNRPAAGRSNASKPYQLGLIAAAGFEVPDTLVTTDPRAARDFLREHGRVVYKSLSGIRSIVATLEAGDAGHLARLDEVRAGPVQLQAYVGGLDVRVHVVGAQCFACAVQCAATDYRYAAATGHAATLSAHELPPELEPRLVALVHGLGLEVGGVDLRHRPDGAWVCFEVNPSPGFPWYEDATGHPIAESIAELLAAR